MVALFLVILLLAAVVEGAGKKPRAKRRRKMGKSWRRSIYRVMPRRNEEEREDVFSHDEGASRWGDVRREETPGSVIPDGSHRPGHIADAPPNSPGGLEYDTSSFIQRPDVPDVSHSEDVGDWDACSIPHNWHLCQNKKKEGANKRNFDATIVQSADIKQVEYSTSPATEWYGYQKKKLRRYKKKLRRYAKHVVWHAPEYVLTILVIWCLQRWFARNFTRVR